MIQKQGIFIIFLFMLLLFPCFALPVHSALSWSIQTVDEYACSSGYGTACPIAVDSKNMPHIAYTSESYPWRAVYASWNGSGWDKQTLAENSFVQCFVLDANDKPHILYLNRNSGYFEYASGTGVNWSIQNTGIKEAEGDYFALALDSSGYPNIAYTEGSKVKYADFTGKTWNIQTVDLATEVLGGISLALDSSNTAYILYSPSSYIDYNLTVGIRAATVRLATYQNSNWNIQTLSLPSPTGQIGNIVVDSKGYPHFMCTQHHFVSAEDTNILTTILYASWDGTTWKTQTVISNINDFQSIGQLTLDAHDNPHFTYLTPAPDGETKSFYVSWTGKAWDSQTIPTSGSETASGNLALDTNGNPNISSRAVSGMRYMAPLLYVTATGTIDVPSTTIAGAERIPDATFLTVAAVAIIASVAAIAYVWKRKIKF
jgi:hypothetical protein